MGKNRPFVWTNTHWIVHSESGIGIDSDISGARGKLHGVHKGEVLSVISEPIEPEYKSYANFQYVKLLYQGTIWYTYTQRITGCCKRLK